MTTQPLKRFYKLAEAGVVPGLDQPQHVVRLDGRLLKTPLRETLYLSTPALASAIADEWQAQGEHIVPDSMPLTQLANTMQDKAAGDERPALNAEVAKYAGSDLVCYLASHPPELLRRQEERWLPLLDWLAQAHGIRLSFVRGIQYVEQDAAALNKMMQLLEGLPAADFTAVQALTGVTGSVVLSLAVTQNELTPHDAYEAACIDEIFQLEKWGDDEIARARLERIRAEIENAARFLSLVSA